MKRNVDGRPVPRHQAHRRAQAAARAFPADHDLIPPNAQLPDVILHIDQRRIAVLGRGRIGALNRQPITGGNDHRAELFDKVYRTGRMNHFLHSRNVPAAVNPQDADGVFRARLRGKHQRRNRPAGSRNPNRGHGDFFIRLHRPHRHSPRTLSHRRNRLHSIGKTIFRT